VSIRVIFLKLCATNGNILQFTPFAHASYAFECPLFYNHHNHEDNVIVTPFAMGTHQDDPLGRHYLLHPILGLYVL
jgi:hypothetical protein